MEVREAKKRYNLVVAPSLYEDLQKVAYIQRRSVSEIAGDLFAKYVEEHKDELIEYYKLKSKE